MSDIDISKIVETELFSLDKAIDYAKSQITNQDYQYHNLDVSFTKEACKNLAEIHSGQKLANEEFLRVAWGKAIRINSEKKGEVIYRLSQAAAIFPSLNIATPQSLVGRLVNIARAGDTYESEILGECIIEDVWYFERFISHEYLENIKNFKNMTSEGKVEFSINNLLIWLKNFMNSSAHIRDVSQQQDEKIGENTSSPWEQITFESGVIEEETLKASEESEHKVIGLSNKFYVNLSVQQYDTAHFGPNGLVYVFGVAGSGKTSVALGRAKSLSQLGQLSKNDKLYNADFPEESQIGIVRTGELIAYLKDTCNMLSLYKLPVVEYREIYEELKILWNIEQSRNNVPKYLLTTTDDDNLGSTIRWFDLISGTMLSVFSDKILDSLNKIPEKISDIDGDIFQKINKILTKEIADYLSSKNPVGYLSRIDDFFRKFIEDIFDQAIWVGVPDRNGSIYWLNDKYHDIAAHLLSTSKVICLSNSRNVQIIVPQSEKNKWKKWVPDHAIFPSGLPDKVPDYVEIITENTDAIKVKLIVVPEYEIIQYAKDGALRFYEGYGERTKTIRTSRLLLAHMPRIMQSNGGQEGAEPKAREWRTRLRKRVLNNIKKPFSNLLLADLFSKSIQNLAASHTDSDRYTALINRKKLQLINNSLSEQDIDVLIAFMASITRGMKEDSPLISNNIKLTPYRSSIFIDEVQDFSEVQIFLLSMLANPRYNSVTAVGDPAQCLYRAASDVAISFPKFLWNNAKRQELRENIRQKYVPTINALGSAFRSKFIDNVVIETEKFNRNEGLQVFHTADSIDQLRLAYKLISNIARVETVVIVVPSIERAKEVIQKLKPYLKERQHRECSYSKIIDLSKSYIAHVTTPRNIKGLEFDHVIALYLDEYDLEKINDKNTLYVIMSRPKRKLSLVANFAKTERSFNKLITQFADIKGLSSA